jgi:transcription elongation factor GreA
VRFGVTVQIEDLDSGEELSFTIVGEDESDVSVGLISVTSPVARALIGKAIEDTAVVTTPAGTRQLEIRAITILER